MRSAQKRTPKKKPHTTQKPLTNNEPTLPTLPKQLPKTKKPTAQAHHARCCIGPFGRMPQNREKRRRYRSSARYARKLCGATSVGQGLCLQARPIRPFFKKPEGCPSSATKKSEKEGKKDRMSQPGRKTVHERGSQKRKNLLSLTLTGIEPFNVGVEKKEYVGRLRERLKIQYQ